MATEYRIEKQTGDAMTWVLADRDADGYTSAEAAENRLKFLREYSFHDRVKLRVVSREIGEWTPVATPLERAIVRLREVMVSNGQLGYQAADVRLLIQAVEQGEH